MLCSILDPPTSPYVQNLRAACSHLLFSGSASKCDKYKHGRNKNPPEIAQGPLIETFCHMLPFCLPAEVSYRNKKVHIQASQKCYQYPQISYHCHDLILFLFAARSYYRCTNPRCNAKKQVERSMDDPETLIVTYEGLHLHYTYSHFLSQTQDHSDADLHVSKKPKILSMSMQTQVAHCPVTESTAWSLSMMEQQKLQPGVIGGQSPQRGLLEEVVQCPVREDTSQQGFFDDLMQSPQGLLEDIVPLLVRKPSNSTTSSFDHRSSSPASSPSYSSISWMPISSYLDVGILPSII